MAEFLVKKLANHRSEVTSTQQLYDLYGKNLGGCLPDRIDLELLHFTIQAKLRNAGLSIENVEGESAQHVFEQPFAVSLYEGFLVK